MASDLFQMRKILIPEGSAGLFRFRWRQLRLRGTLENAAIATCP